MANELIKVENEMGSWASFKVETKEEKIMVYNGISNPDKKLADCIGQIVLVKDIYVEMSTMVNKETGETDVAPRIVLFDKDRHSYQAVSFGIFNSLKRIFDIFGTPDTWSEPLGMRVKQITTGKNKMLTIEVV